MEENIFSRFNRTRKAFILNKNAAGAAAILFAFLSITVMFAFISLPGGDDWETFYGAAQRVLNGTPLYGTKITFSYFYNAPWLAILLAPLGALPFRWGLSLLSTFSILNIFLLCRRWKLSMIQFIVILLSPPMLYTLLHGNIDAFLLAFVFLPKEFWVVAALTKPQTTIALSIGALQGSWKKTVLITGSIFLLSFIILGNWLTAYIAQPLVIINEGHNLFRSIWPYQIIIGLVLAYIGWKQEDEKFLLGASPFFSPYAATSTMIGPYILLISKLKDWQTIVFLAIYWCGSVLLARF